VFFFFEFHFDLFHFFAYTLLGRHFYALSQQFQAKDKEEGCGSVVDEAFWKEGGHSVTQESGENSHCDEGGEGGAEDDGAWVAHGHQCCDEEGFVTDFGKDDH